MKHIAITLSICAAAFWLTVQAQAQTPRAAKTEPQAVVDTACGADPADVALAYCLAKLLDKANADEQAKYRAVEKFVNGFDPGDLPRDDIALMKKSLPASEKAWRTSVKQLCYDVWQTSIGTGTAHFNAGLRCELDLTWERTDDLDQIFYVPLHD